MVLIVAITRWGPGLDAQLPELAAYLGMFPYDLRMRLSGPLPVVIARLHEREAALALQAKLRGWGHGVVGCDAANVFAAETMHQPRDFRFEGERLLTEGFGSARAEVHAPEVYGFIHAMVVADHQRTQERTNKQFSATRAVLSGGLVMSRKATATSHVTESESEERIYLIRVIRGSFSDPILFCQHQLRYQGLGADMGHSSHESFAALTRRLRAFAPNAFYDDQLRVTRRKATFEGATQEQSSGGKVKTSTVTSSNASGIDLAAYLLLVAHARGQL